MIIFCIEMNCARARIHASGVTVSRVKLPLAWTVHMCMQTAHKWNESNHMHTRRVNEIESIFKRKL